MTKLKTLAIGFLLAVAAYENAAAGSQSKGQSQVHAPTIVTQEDADEAKAKAIAHCQAMGKVAKFRVLPGPRNQPIYQHKCEGGGPLKW